ncbi:MULTISPECIES: hypothetical protein [unclassified Mesorhizobium]|uniref:hypothetical protein n=1 Tax=unclassified Mesorhizobium TaxID=325217 RepID=UPI00109358B0|nr:MULTISPECIES: hypothetical protein [unclassified Mesorhizobium]TGS37802.1 hypothetical protein EN825_31000 [Mesorhizobium sp. M8A.F.Ca.ET.182.01.1.1]TGS76717.1 hypothetical protein EN824_30355 [Mesorhizobium sp. M8A.F.Ca.ET.181.01.1.1]
MGQPIVIHALIAKRAELSGQVIDLDRQKAVLKSQLQTIDEALAIFGYAGSPGDIEPKVTSVRLFKRNELARLLRKDGCHGTNREVALRIMAVKAWDAADRNLVAKVIGSVKGAKKWAACRRRLVAVGHDSRPQE